MTMKIVKLIWQDVCLWDEVELLPAEALLHLDIVVAETVLTSDLMTLREVINSLELVKAFVKVAFTRTC